MPQPHEVFLKVDIEPGYVLILSRHMTPVDFFACIFSAFAFFRHITTSKPLQKNLNLKKIETH